MTALTTLLATVGAMIVAAAGAGSWLDAKPLPNWNTAATLTVPARPGAADPDFAPGGQCVSTTRPATSLEDRAVAARGWALIGPYQQFGPLVVIFATSSADGMCRPEGFQGFAFVGGTFAGTLSPQLMGARADGSIDSASAYLSSTTVFNAKFSRYSDSDALCCPHAMTTVIYQIQSFGGKPHVVVTGDDTEKSGS